MQKRSPIIQRCYICKKVYDIISDFQSHILLNHQSEFNCHGFFFRWGTNRSYSQRTLTKGRKMNQSKATIILNVINLSCCSPPNKYFTMTNKISVEVTKTVNSKKQGRCNVPDSECWNRHTN